MLVKIDVEEVLKLKARLREINAISPFDIQWIYKRKPLQVPQSAVEQWCFIGLNTSDFVETVLVDRYF
jgi:hypothetical protein